MNFPTTHKTGHRAELAVEDLFMSWDWNVGQDRIDIGYDLCITPDQNIYRGLRFLVQVKGTAVSSKRPKALVASSRLRQYAASILPVFILRVASDKTIYWVHAQAWAATNREALLDKERRTVTFDPARTMEDRKLFEQYLQESIRSLIQTKDRLSIEIEGRNFTPNAKKITPKQLQPSKTREAPSLYPPPNANISFRPIDSPENIERLKDAYEYGLPRSFDVSDFKITPSSNSPNIIPPTSPSKGMVTIKQTSAKKGIVSICPGREYSVLASELILPADLFSGSKGSGITNELQPSPINLILRLTQEETRLKTVLNIGIRAGYFQENVLQSFHELAPLASWAEQVAAENSMHIALDFDNQRIELKPPVESVDGWLPVLQRIRSLSRLHMITRVLNSNFSVGKDDIFSSEDFEDIDLAFELLRGAKKSVNIGPMEVDLSNNGALRPTKVAGEFLCETQWSLEVAGKEVGNIPVEISMTNYVMDVIPNSNRVSITKDERGQAWLRHSKTMVSSGKVRRNR